MAASNAEVLESLKIEIDVGIRGQAKLERFSERLTILSTALADVNQRLAEYARLAGSVGSFRLPRIGTTGGGATPTAEGVPLNSTAIAKVASEAQSATSSMRQLSVATKSVNGELSKTSSAAKKAGDAAKKSTGHFGNLLKTFIRIAKYRAIRSVLRAITEGFRTGVQNLARYSSDFNDTMSQFSTSTLYLKNALGTLAQPIIELLVPALQKVIEWIVKAINKLNEFIAAMKGESTYTAAKVYFVDYAKNLDKAAKSAKEIKNTLMGFDEINRLDEQKTDTSDEMDYSKMFEEKSVSEGVQAFANKVNELIDKVKDGLGKVKENWDKFWESDFGESLKLTFKDVFLDWSELNPEQIAEKILVGLGALLGAVAGFAIGGVPGAILGLIIGTGLSLVASALIFDHDGKLSAEEIVSMVVGVLTAICGGIIGWRIGGWKGAAVGAFIGFEAGLILSSMIFDHDGVISRDEIQRLLIPVLTAAVGGVIGFSVGGAGGALLGAAIGFSVGLLLTSLGFKVADSLVPADMDISELEKKVEEVKNKVIDVLLGALLALGLGAAATAAGVTMTIPLAIVLAIAGATAAMGGSITSIPTAASMAAEEFKNAWDNGFNSNPEASGFAKFFNGCVSVVDNVLTNIGGMITTVLDDWFDFTEKKKAFENFIDYLWLQLKNFFAKIKMPHFSWGPDTIDLPEWAKKALDFLHIPSAIPKFHIDWYAQGGFPEDGLFMANHSELVGKFSNGRTAVANNEQIEAGIEEAAYRGFTRAMSGNGGNGTYTFIAQLNGKTIFEEVVKQNNQDSRQRGFNRLATI